MNILILINQAPNYISFLKPLGDTFKTNGHNVIYACESHLPEIKYETLLDNEERYYFTEYEEAIDSNILDKYQGINLRSWYYSCYDRNYHYDVNNEIDKELDHIILRLVSFFEKIVTNNNIDLVIYENVSNSFAHAAYTVANFYKKKYFGLITSRIPGRYEVWTDEYGNVEKRGEMLETKYGEEPKTENNKIINEYLETFYNNNAEPDYMQANPTSMKVNYIKYYYNKLNIVNRYLEYYRKYPTDVEGAYQSAFPLKVAFKSLVRNFKRKSKLRLLEKTYDQIKSSEKYIVYPMHFQPESSTSVNAMFYDNQYEVIKNVAFSMPVGIQLYVKDHPNGIGFLDMNFYKKIKRLPNVKYIDPLTDTKELLEGSEAIITLTSTMGFEALLLRKPVITLGNVFYNYHPYCFVVEGYKDIFKTILMALDFKYTDFDKINKQFLTVYFEDTFEGRLFNEKSNYKKIYKDLIYYYNKKSINNTI